jgi:hypothetical protein
MVAGLTKLGLVVIVVHTPTVERLRQPLLAGAVLRGRGRHHPRHHLGERRYEQSERAVQRLLSVELVGVEGLDALIGVLGFPP